MIEARMQREQMAHVRAALPERMRYQKGGGFWAGMKRLLSLEENNLWFLSGLAVLIAVVIIGWRIGSQRGAGGPQTDQAVGADSRAIDTLKAQVSVLNERVAMLTDSIYYLESKLTRAHVLTDSNITAEKRLDASSARERAAMGEPEQVIEELPPPAAGQKAGHADLAHPAPHAAGGVEDEMKSRRPSAAAVTKVRGRANASTAGGAAGQSSPGKAVASATGLAATRVDQMSMDKKRPAGSAGRGGPWVINLVSSPSKADADRFAARARASDIETEQQQVTVKGRQYWRVQITGFASAEEARAYAGTARAKLGLEDVWITRR
jgi:hypothetical protein